MCVHWQAQADRSTSTSKLLASNANEFQVEVADPAQAARGTASGSDSKTPSESGGPILVQTSNGVRHLTLLLCV